MAQGGGKGDDSDTTLLLLAAILLAVCWGLWVVAKQPLVSVISGVKWIELTVFQLVDPRLAQDRAMIENLANNQDAVNRLDEAAKLGKKKLSIADYEKAGLLAPDVLWTVSNHIGLYTRWPIAIAFLVFASFYMFYSKKNKFKTHYDLEGLMRVQAKHWPVITPIINFDPAQANARNPGEPVPTELPLFAEALTPEEWVVHNDIALVNKMPDKDAMRRAFQQQLGPRWTGLDGLTQSQRCLFAAFILKGAQKRKESDALLGRIALAWDYKADFVPTGELMAEVNRVIGNEDYLEPALKIANNFAYRTTALLGVLKWGRERGGVLAPASFLWLRGHDRALWYPLNNLGRRAYHVEASGAMSHYMAEVHAKRALPLPRLETAMFSLIQYWGRDEFKDMGGPRLPPKDDGKKKRRA